MPLLLFLPETCRALVDDGSIPPPKLNTNISDIIRHRNRAAANLPINKEKQAELHKNYKISIPNPLSTLVILLDKEAAFILIATALAVACVYAISTGASEAFKTVYGFNEIQIALMFIPIGVGSTISAFTTGKLVDWNYRRHAKLNNFPFKKNRRQDLTSFPLEQARLQIAIPLFYVGAATIVAYGWVMDIHTSLAVPIILLFILGYTLSAAFQVLSILMVDIYPGRPATATAANNLVRCELGAAASAVISPMANAMGRGWAYTTLALIFLAGSPALWVIMRCGLKWRGERKVKEDRAEGKRRVRTEKKERTPDGGA
jgi:MFS family permease